MPSSTDTDLSRNPTESSPHCTQVCERLRSSRLTHRWIQEELTHASKGALGVVFLSCRNNHHTDKTRKLPRRALSLLKRPWAAQSLSAQTPSTARQTSLSATDTVSRKAGSSGFPEYCSFHCESRRVSLRRTAKSRWQEVLSALGPPDTLARRESAPRPGRWEDTQWPQVPGCWAASGRLVGLGCTQRPPRLRGGLRAGRGRRAHVLTTRTPPEVSVGPAGGRKARQPGPG